MRILVIDDDPDLLDNISLMLEIAGYEVFRANNGMDGLRKVHDYHPELIVCDVVMPEISGYDVLEELQANSNTATIPLIFLTSKSEIQDVRHGMQAGADDYLTKPFTEQDLLTTIHKHVEKRHQRELQQRIAFAHDLVQTHEEESQRMAHELNQEFRQKLLNIKFYLDSQILNPSASNESLMATVQNSLQELLDHITALTYMTYPSLLTDLGLIATLHWYFNTIQQRLNIKVKFEIYNMDARLLDSVELVFYRMVQWIINRISSEIHDIHVMLWRDENSALLSISPLVIQNKDQQRKLIQLLEEYAYTINAHVTLQEDEENSSTICITLPDAVFQQPEIMPPLPRLHTQTPQSNVLLAVSPDEVFLEQVTRILDSIVHVIPHQTTNSDSLLTTVSVHTPQLLLLDLFVPSSVLSSLSRETSVILLSPYSDEAFAKQTMRQGVMGIIPKVKVYTELVAAVQSVIHGEHYISATIILGSDQSQNPKRLNLDMLLTRREREIMELILHDLTHAEIASRLVISPRTVEKHRANMMQKLALNTHTELILFALRHGLMSST